MSQEPCHESRWLAPIICVLLLAAVWMVFGQTIHFGFVNLDDPLAVSENPRVSAELSWRGIALAFASNEVGHWVPLTVFSRMLDCHFYGLWAGGHHMTNVILHGASALLLFLVLRSMTGALWRSAFVAAVFGIHPLRAESVAWVTERKDVLSGLFFMLTLAAYLRYARRPLLGRYMGVAVFLGCGLMSKSMLVTLPCVLALLDYWPLGRWATEGRRRLVLEKVPLLAMSAGSALATIFSNRNAIKPLAEFPLPMRMENAIVAAATYLGQFLHPSGLAVFYPHLKSGLPVWQIWVAGCVLAFVSAGVWLARRSHPYALTGWLWYLGMLVPVIGFIQSGEIARADRYTYLPGIGVAILLTWSVADLCTTRPAAQHTLGAAAAASIVFLMVTAQAQTASWRDSVALWEHALACTEPSAFAEDNLAVALAESGRGEEAIAHYHKALEIDPRYPNVHHNLGVALMGTGKTEEAISEFRRTLELAPHFPGTRVNLARALMSKGDTGGATREFRIALDSAADEAMAHFNLAQSLAQQNNEDEARLHFQKGLEIKPRDSMAHLGLAQILARQDRLDEAKKHARTALSIQPNLVRAHLLLARILIQEGKVRNALLQWQAASELAPSNPSPPNELAWTLATCPEAAVRDGPRARQLARKAVELSGGNEPVFLDTLAAAQAECVQFPDAVETAKRAFALARQQGNTTLAAAIEERLALYQSGQPFHEAPSVRK